MSHNIEVMGVSMVVAPSSISNAPLMTVRFSPPRFRGVKVLLLHHVDDFVLAGSSEDIAKAIYDIIGARLILPDDEEPPFASKTRLHWRELLANLHVRVP